ncbi:HAMP domain-containing sensor histidine kinase [Candidatus Igneacidithiobacillus taiwanensis]|uniref:sensor histidine kinase n=1 Tax=Candidatus Igneacidithiobacillus taiwanensis TaxID=1945924 RepID=UPI00289A562F|nr:HAMP domain-containing sensor histidine kinase [Candidatus Igneacidithiobacillus taiwanensis]
MIPTIPRLWQRLTWRSKSMALVVLLIAMIYLLIAAFLYTSVREDLSSQVETETRHLTESIALSAANPLLLKDAGQLAQLTHKPNSLVSGILIVGRNNTILASDQLAEVGTHLTADALQKISKQYTYSAPIVAGTQRLGTVWLRSNAKEINAVIAKKLEHTTSRLLFLGISTAVIGLIGAYLVSLAITRPVSRLRREMEFMERQLGIQNEPPSTEPDDYHDELHHLELAFRSLATRLHEHLLELRKLHQRQQAMQCMVTIGQMSSQVAHEIRNALSSVRGAARYLVRYDDRDNREEFLRIIEEEVQRLYDMTQGFLDFGRSYDAKLENQELCLFLQRCLQRHQSDFDARSIAVHLNCQAPIHANFDASLLAQAMSNLLLNACDAVPNPGGKIVVTAEPNVEGIQIRVQDNGPGVPEERRSEIFKPYVTSKTKGSGLGLAVVAKIMMVHEGSVELVQTSDAGACFVLSLPLRAEKPPILENES